MTKKQIITAVRKELKQNIDKTYDLQRFFKEPIKFYGVRSVAKKKIARELFELVKNKELAEFLSICEELLRSGYMEEVGIGLGWAFRRRRDYKKSDFKIFENWLKKYIDNWGVCDGFCCDLLGWFLVKYPELISQLKIWTKFSNQWVRRAAAVSLITPIRADKKFLKQVFKVADLLLEDKDDMVQKGYGWLLKETSNLYQTQVFAFVMKRRHRMPRTALRYAIEKMPQAMRQKAMK